MIKLEVMFLENTIEIKEFLCSCAIKLKVAAEHIYREIMYHWDRFLRVLALD